MNDKYLHQFVGKVRLKNTPKYFNIIGFCGEITEEVTAPFSSLYLDLPKGGTQVSSEIIDIDSIIWKNPNQEKLQWQH